MCWCFRGMAPVWNILGSLGGLIAMGMATESLCRRRGTGGLVKGFAESEE